MTLDILEKLGIDISIEMDKNPLLYKELRQRKQRYSISVRISEKESRGHDLIQLADYVTALQARVLKYPDRSGVKGAYKIISKKLLSSINI